MNRVKLFRVTLVVLSATILLLFSTPVFANEIDDLKTDEDVESFMQKQNKKFKDFHVASIKTLYYDPLQQKIADSLGIKPWQKVDFDNNELSDLLVYGMLGGNTHMPFSYTSGSISLIANAIKLFHQSFCRRYRRLGNTLY